MFDKILNVIGPLGELWVTLPFAVVLVVWCLLSKQYRGAFLLLAVILGTVAIVAVIKLFATLIGPPWRPQWEYVSNLFPSGHAAMGTVVYGSLLICMSRAKTAFFRPCAVAVIGMVALICVQRVVSGSHPLLDVAGGLAIGCAALLTLRHFWPSGSLRQIGLPALVIAAVFILLNFYGRQVDSARMVSQTVAQMRVAVSDIEGYLVQH